MMPSKELKMLVVEDDLVDRLAFERFVKKNNLAYDYQVASSIAEAEILLESNTFDIVITDYMLGDGTGLELFDRMQDLPVIVVTGTGNEEVAVTAMKRGAYDYLIKDPQGYYLTTLPVTVEKALKHKRAEDELAGYRKDLEALVKKRTRELEKVIVERKKAETQLRQAQKMEAMGTLAGGIAHDFNNILSSILGFTELAQMRVPENHEIQSDLAQILNAGNRAKDLVQQILTFSRKTDQELKPIQMRLVVLEALKLLRASIPTTIDIQQTVVSKSLIMGDPTQIHQVLMNLCTNAAHAMQEGNGKLSVGLSDTEIDHGFAGKHPEMKPGPHIKLTVNDTGCGIPAEVLHRVFDPFFTTKTTGEGTGMGLSVVHGIVTSHRGAVTVYSEPNKGSTFTLFFPAIKEAQPIKKNNDTPIPKGTERILFVDDESTIVELSQRTLEALGYTVFTCSDSIKALEHVRRDPRAIDLVVTDMTMPRMTGDALAREIMGIRPDLPVILCTGFSSRIDENEAIEMGIRAFVSKPILRADLARTIRKVLDKPADEC
jgi:signal transduction histidine kinase